MHAMGASASHRHNGATGRNGLRPRSMWYRATSSFHQIEPAVVSTLRAKERNGVQTTVSEYFSLRSGILNSPTMVEILENHQSENDFEPGDALLFNKMVILRSVMLGEGPLPRRAAYVMRFVDAGSHYDLERARNLEFPVERYGQGLFPYKPFSRQHIEIAEAGADGRRPASGVCLFRQPWPTHDPACPIRPRRMIPRCRASRLGRRSQPGDSEALEALSEAEFT